MELIDLGYHPELKEIDNGFSIGRIVSVNKESYNINDGIKEYFGKLTGNMMYSSDSPEDFPTVGDFVTFQSFDEESVVMIHKVLERKSLLKRKSPGKKVEYQLIAANVDYAIIMQSLDKNYNTNRLERYLSMVREFGITPIILFSKADLVNEKIRIEIEKTLAVSNPDVIILSFSNHEVEGVKKVYDFLLAKKTYCLLGSSGVGKTTLINNLVGEIEFKTKEVRSSDSRGRHTTTNRNLIVLENGSMIIDTPGMRELANISVSDGLEQTFDEIANLARKCKFSDCSHTSELGCAVLEALDAGTIDEKRFDNFLKLRKESDHYERSYLERKRRDKEFGKMIKSVMKYNKRK